MTPDELVAQYRSSLLASPAEETAPPEPDPGGLDQRWKLYKAQADAANDPAMNGGPSDLGYAAPYAEVTNDNKSEAAEKEGADEIEKHGPSAGLHAGHWTDDEGDGHVGAQAALKLFEMKRKINGAGDTEWTFDAELGGEAGMEASGNGVEGEVGGGKRAFTPGMPSPKAQGGFKAGLGFASHNAKSSHDRGYKVSMFAGKSTEKEGLGLPVSFGMTDKDGDGNPEYRVGMKVPTPWGYVGADYETETPVSDYASSLLSPFGMPLNIGMSMLGLGDYAPGTLLHDGVGWLGDKIFGGDDEPSAFEMAGVHRSTERMVDAQVKSGMSREQAELVARSIDPSLAEARDLDKSSEDLYAKMIKAGVPAEAAEATAGAANPGWRQLRQVDRAAKSQYDSLVMGGVDPARARSIAQVMDPSWEPSAASTGRPVPAAPAGPSSKKEERVCRADDNPFAAFAD